MNKLAKPDKIIRKLLEFTPLQYMLDSIEENPKLAHIYIDNKKNSCMVLIGCYLFVGGDATDEVVKYLNNSILTDEARKKLEVMIVFYPNDKWKNAITKIFGKGCNIYERSLYRIKPTSYIKIDSNCKSSIRRIDYKLFNSDVKNTDLILDEVTTYESIGDFVKRGVGFAPIIDNTVQGFCTSEYPTKTELAIGIRVLEQYQRIGIARTMTQMLLNEAFNKNLIVNWECWKYNTASFKTALSCGFEHIADYPVIFIDFLD